MFLFRAGKAGLRSSRLSSGMSSLRCFSSISNFDRYPFLKELGLSEVNQGVYDGEFKASGDLKNMINPVDNSVIAQVQFGTADDYEACLSAMDAAKPIWANTPAPVRGEVVRKLGEALRKYKRPLGQLVALEMGKILPEGEGEVQEAIDICDYAVGLSRMLNGSVIPSERPDHFMMERYNPLAGHVGIISAFNFPCAVAFWNLAISMVCGNTNIWKGADSTSLVTVACTKIVADVLKAEGFPGGIATTCQGTGAEIGDRLVRDPRIELVSFTGSTKVGKGVAEICAQRFARSILELGGNNSTIVMADADVELAKRAVLFSAVGTAGQRCTTLRRLYVQEGIYDSFVPEIVKAWGNVKIGDPLDEGVLCGPVHSPASIEAYKEAILKAQEQGGQVLTGGNVLDREGNFVEPTVIAIDKDAEIVKHEYFVPIMYVMKIDNVEEAIQCNNNVPQGLSSSLFTTNQADVFKWTGPLGSDCGIVNVNIGPSGAEIGGAFGGQKETGWGRESGSDAWKQYMRRSTCTVNYGEDLPLAQGISFD